MITSYILDPLNEAQRQAVTAPIDRHLLVLAGAGSGKTRVLVHRIAWLIKQQGISTHEILAVTFTNKAASEMRGRIERILDTPIHNMWVGTFHGLAHRLLRLHWQEAGLAQSFQVLDSEDQQRLIRRILKNLNIDEEKWPAKQAQWFINSQKDEGLRSHQIETHGRAFLETMRTIYGEYEAICNRNNMVDFAELLLRSYELLRNNPELLTHYQQRFQHILADEFQDTNILQYAWLKLFAGKTTKLMIVGDDDQSIYSWRGAKVEHIRHFTQDYPETIQIRLEQNYRSTGVILHAANAVIAHNNNRLGKNLWTAENQGEPISLYSGFNDIDEAQFIVHQIQKMSATGFSLCDFAILYRSNAQSRVIEEQLIRANISYRIYGGLKFFERAEVKDALAYLRVIANHNDDGAFERIINTPPRGIGNQTIELLRAQARNKSTTLWQIAHSVVNEKILASRAHNALHGFLQLMDDLIQSMAAMKLHEQTQYLLQKSGLLDHYRKDSSEKGISRVENLEELVHATGQFTPDDDMKLPPLDAFLSYVALETGEHQGESSTDYVHLMTLHAAKGLEFPVVFQSGMEEGLFPHQMSRNEPSQIEEERRLCYVGMTRAMQKLFLTYAQTRRLHGHETYQRPSRFIQEIPPEIIEEVRLNSRVSRPVQLSAPPTSSLFNINLSKEIGFTLGQLVKHSKFGEGVVINYEGRDEHARIQVKFTDFGVKWLIVSIAKLEPV